MPDAESSQDAVGVAAALARELGARGEDYAIGGAIALGFWGAPRGTLDVDVTLFVAQDKPSNCIWILQDVGCQVDSASAVESLREHGFCRVAFAGLRVDVFVPTIPFYETARRRRRKMRLADQDVWIWDAETLAVFKLMFFRRKDLADLEQILRTQNPSFDHVWVRTQVAEIYGQRDPRLASWDELVRETTS